ncbi:MAG: HipA domain-containing protein, partial [Rhodothermales bacterium]
MPRCPITYEEIPAGRYSRAGLRRLSRRLTELEDLPFTPDELRREALARASKMSIQGLQPKLSAILNVPEHRFDIVDRGGNYILKPPIPDYPQVPENEDVTMRMAGAAGIEVPMHGMIYTSDGARCYFIRRFDRVGRSAKRAVEDFAQLLGRTRDTKYDASLEQVLGVIDRYCTFPAVERLKLFRRVLFAFLCGNEDMHLKNVSLITRDNMVELSPAYDLVNTTIVLANPQEEMALP